MRRLRCAPAGAVAHGVLDNRQCNSSTGMGRPGEQVVRRAPTRTVMAIEPTWQRRPTRSGLHVGDLRERAPGRTRTCDLEIRASGLWMVVDVCGGASSPAQIIYAGGRRRSVIVDICCRWGGGI